MSKLHDAIDDAIGGKASFGDVVTRYKLTATTTPPILPTGANPEDAKAQPDPKLAQIAQAAFAMDPAEGPQMAPVGQDGSFALVMIDKIVAAAPRPMAQMHDTVVKDFIADRNLREARKIADAVSAQLAKGVPFAQALSATGLTLKPAQTVSAARAQLIQRPNSPPPPDNDRTVVIIIDKQKAWKLNNEDTTPDRLQDRLIEVFKTRAEKVVFIKGDPDLDFATVARAIDIAHGAGIDKVGLMTPKVELGQ